MVSPYQISHYVYFLPQQILFVFILFHTSWYLTYSLTNLIGYTITVPRAAYFFYSVSHIFKWRLILILPCGHMKMDLYCRWIRLYIFFHKSAIPLAATHTSLNYFENFSQELSSDWLEKNQFFTEPIRWDRATPNIYESGYLFKGDIVVIAIGHFIAISEY